MAFTLTDAISFAGNETAAFSGKFFGPADNLGLGAGLLYGGLTYPVYSVQERRFKAVQGPVLVLTHECDVDTGNDKMFNSDVIFAPIGPLDEIYDKLSTKRTEDQVKGYLGDLVHDRISQLFYLPPCNACTSGGAAYFNRIGHTHADEFAGAGVKPLEALSAFAYDRLGRALQNHLLRPKDDRLPLTVGSFDFMQAKD